MVDVDAELLQHDVARRADTEALDAHAVVGIAIPAELDRRLTKRILEHGHDEAYAKNWITSNDLLNADEVIGNSAMADVVL